MNKITLYLYENWRPCRGRSGAWIYGPYMAAIVDDIGHLSADDLTRLFRVQELLGRSWSFVRYGEDAERRLQ